MSFDTAQVSAELSARGLRLTRQRRAVLDAIAATPSSLSPLQVYDAARDRCPELGLTTVYRTLEVLDEIGALRRVHGHDHCESFVPASAGARPHGGLQRLRPGHRVHRLRHARHRRRGRPGDGLPHHRPLPAAQRPLRRLPRAQDASSPGDAS